MAASAPARVPLLGCSRRSLAARVDSCGQQQDMVRPGLGNLSSQGSFGSSRLAFSPGSQRLSSGGQLLVPRKNPDGETFSHAARKPLEKQLSWPGLRSGAQPLVPRRNPKTAAQHTAQGKRGRSKVEHSHAVCKPLEKAIPNSRSQLLVRRRNLETVQHTAQAKRDRSESSSSRSTSSSSSSSTSRKQKSRSRDGSRGSAPSSFDTWQQQRAGPSPSWHETGSKADGSEGQSNETKADGSARQSNQTATETVWGQSAGKSQQRQARAETEAEAGAEWAAGTETEWAAGRTPELQRASGDDFRRITLSVLLLGLLTWLQVSLEGKLPSFLEDALGLVTQGLFFVVAVDVSLTLGAWISGFLAVGTGVTRCPACRGLFQFDREAVQRFQLQATADEARFSMACPSCKVELVYTGLGNEPFFARPSDAFGSSAFQSARQPRRSWAPEDGTKVVDVDADVKDKD